MSTQHQSRHHRLLSGRAGDRERVLRVANMISAPLRGDFFRSLVEHLSSALNVDCAYVAELTRGAEDTVRTIAVYRGTALAPNFEQPLPGTASSQVLMDGAVSLSADAGRIFPLDCLLAEIGAEAYVGLQLNDSTGQIMGLIAVVNQEPLQDRILVTSILQAFAVRAASELEHQRRYESIRESEERYKAFISSSSDAMWRIELRNPVSLDLPEDEQITAIYRDGYLAECNPAMARLAGVGGIEDAIGKPFSSLFARVPRIREELRSFVCSGYRGSTVHVIRGEQGELRYRLRTQAGIVEKNNLLRIWGTTRDITELKTAEAAAAESERRLFEVLESIHLPGFMLDQEGRIIFCNDYLAGLTGLSSYDLTGRDWRDLIGSRHERDEWTDLLSGSRDSKQHCHIDGFLEVDGVATPVAWDAIVLRATQGELAGLVAIGRDSTLRFPANGHLM